MNMTKIIAISGFAVLLMGCSPSQSQIEGTGPAFAAAGAKHSHNVEGYGDFTHSHKGNSTKNHGHTWAEIQAEIKKRTGQ